MGARYITYSRICLSTTVWMFVSLNRIGSRCTWIIYTVGFRFACGATFGTLDIDRDEVAHCTSLNMRGEGRFEREELGKIQDDMWNPMTLIYGRVLMILAWASVRTYCRFSTIPDVTRHKDVRRPVFAKMSRVAGLLRRAPSPFWALKRRFGGPTALIW